MDTEHKLEVLVIGSTGRQGGAVARKLLARGHRVRAFTRKPHSPAAKALAALGADITGGDLSDETCLEGAAANVDAIFSVTNWREGGPDLEVKHGRAVADAAKNMGTPHLVFSSVASANRHTGIPHFESKFAVEEHIAALGIPATIVAPVSFMENFLAPASLSALREGRLVRHLPVSRGRQLVAVEDIGGFVTSLMEQRDDVLGDRFDIAGDEVTGEQEADILSRVTGRKVRCESVPLEPRGAGDRESAVMHEWIDRVGYSADIRDLALEFPEVGWHRLESWAREQDWAALLG
jgi:uncharacterized protein YbjT (DUF2867 family)